MSTSISYLFKMYTCVFHSRTRMFCCPALRVDQPHSHATTMAATRPVPPSTPTLSVSLCPTSPSPLAPTPPSSVAPHNSKAPVSRHSFPPPTTSQLKLSVLRAGTRDPHPMASPLTPPRLSPPPQSCTTMSPTR